MGGGQLIRAVAKEDRMSKELQAMYHRVYTGMNKVCEGYLKRDGLGLELYTTHILRRLYVCYSFDSLDGVG